jgi:hypothetical protein
LHLSVDTETGQIVAAALARKQADDGLDVSPVLAKSPVHSIRSGPGAYDQGGVYPI